MGGAAACSVSAVSRTTLFTRGSVSAATLRRRAPAPRAAPSYRAARASVSSAAGRSPRTRRRRHRCPRPIATRPSTSPRRSSPRKAALEGERKQVTVLFADLKGSMELLADRDPEDARQLLDPVLERMMDAVHRYEGTVNQVMGDGIMALFGAPLAHEDHARAGLLRRAEDAGGGAALLGGAAARRRASSVQIRVGPQLRRRRGALHRQRSPHGLHRGGPDHASGRPHGAARRRPGSILPRPGDTAAWPKGLSRCTPLGPVPIKGLPDPVEVFELMGAGAARTRLEAAARRGLTRFVGRQRRAGAAARRARRGPAVAMVRWSRWSGSRAWASHGCSGSCTHSHRVHGWLILQSASVSYGKATAYLPVIDLLRVYFEIEEPRRSLAGSGRRSRARC